MKIIYVQEGLTDRELSSYKNAIYTNILATISSLSKYCKKKDIPFEKEDNFKKSFKIEEISDQQNGDEMTTVYDNQIADHVESIWKDSAIQKAFLEAKGELHIFDGAE